MNLEYLKAQNSLLEKKLLNSLKKNIKNSDFILGKDVNLLEKKLSQYVGSKYCCTVSSGTDALLIALKLLNIKPGDEIITSAFSWISAVEMITLLGAIPRFCDIDPLTFNINPKEIKRYINNKTKAIIPISLFGQICNIKEINLIAKKNNLKVIEDAAQSFGSYENNIKSCSCADISITSFFPTKPLGTLGDGGAIFVNNDKYYKKALKYRNHGQLSKGNFELVGYNSRLDTLKASFLIQKLKIFEKELNLRQKIYKNYKKLIERANLNIALPFIKPNVISAFAQFPILTSKSNRRKIEIFNKNSNSFNYPIFYKKPIYNLKPYKSFKTETLPITEQICKTIFCLPFNPYMKFKDQVTIINKLRKIIS